MSWAMEAELLNALNPRNGFIISRHTITSTPARLGCTTIPGRSKLYIYHESGGVLYIGDSAVSTPTGFKLSGSIRHEFPFAKDIVVFGMASTSTDVHVVEVY